MPQKKLPTEPFPPPFVTVDGNSIFFGEDPVSLKCPKCNQQTTTSTETAPGLLGKNKTKTMIFLTFGECLKQRISNSFLFIISLAFILGGCLAGSG